MSDASNKPLWPTVLAVIGVFALFLIILQVARTPTQPLGPAAGLPPEEQWRASADGRRARLQELRGREQTALSGYGWVDQQAGVVRLPLDRAIELVIAEANGGAAQAGGAQPAAR
jgi:hypothetical protein